MRNSSEYAERLNRLSRRIRRDEGAPEESSLSDPIGEIVLGCLSMYQSEGKALHAISRLKNYFVDFNDLRVSPANEVSRVLGSHYPHGMEVSRILVRSLREIYEQCHGLDLSELSKGGKLTAKAMLEGIDGLNDYVVSCVMLRSLGGHAFPVNEKMLSMLQGEEVVDSKASVSDVQGFLERQIPAKQIRKTFALLRRYADGYTVKKSKPKAKAAKAKVSLTKESKKKSSAGAVVKKAAAKRSVKKKAGAASGKGKKE